MRPLVSVIIPVYNVAPYLREALDSVIRQTYCNLEILIIDDGSTDGSGDVCDEYKSDSRVTIIHQENRGLSNARNNGLDRMTGEFVCFLDSDDAYDGSFVEKLVIAMLSEQPDMVVCRYTIYSTIEEMRDFTNKKGLTKPLLEEGKYKRDDALRALVDGQLNTSVWNKLYRRFLWTEIRFPDGHNYEDIDTFYRVLDICSSVYMINQSLYLHRKHPGSITQTFTKNNVKDINLARSHLEAYVQAHIPETFSKEQLVRIMQSRVKVMIIQYAKVSNERPYREELRQEILDLGQKAGMEGQRLMIRVAYDMLRICPRLFRMSYSVYIPVRLFIKKIIGK